MGLYIDNVTFENGRTAVLAHTSVDVRMTNSQIIGCERGVVLMDDDLDDIVQRIQGLKLNTKTEEDLRLEAISLIQKQRSTPSKEFLISLRNIFEGATGSMLYTVVCAWVNSLAA